MKRERGAMPYVERRSTVMIATFVLFTVSLVALIVCCMLGSARFSLGELWGVVALRFQGEAAATPVSLILFGIRLPRAILSFLVGAALSICGVCMQGVFKNPMADPHILGVSSGSALGAAIVMIIGAQGTAIGMIPVGAFLGGAAAVLLVLSLARTHGRTSTIVLLLSGVAVSTFLSAILSGLLTLNHEKMESVYLWTMGSFSAASWPKIQILAPVVVAGFILLRIFARDLNALMMGEEEARSMGISVDRVQRVVLLVSTLITATAVSFSGVIGFVGLMIPHAVRSITGPDHRITLPVSFFVGGLYLMLMDTLARTVFLPAELPVGVLTALVGGPFFLFLLKRSKSQL